MSKLTFDENGFYLDNEPFRIFSGAIHYFRIVPEYWEDRLLKLKECGFNTVETYIPWNLHERREGEYCFEGILDLLKFIETAKKLDLYVMLRPGPYICAEWEMGGLPSWLLNVPGLKIRCMNEPFLEKMKAYLHVIFQKLMPCFIENGGNVIAMAVENEYGSYGDDAEYLLAVKKIYEDEKVPCLLYTADGPGYFMLSGGTIKDTLATVNFGSNPKDNFALLRRFRSNQPNMCMEYWNGWFDHWYEEHHTRASDDTADVFEEILGENNSINLYMFHGGTNFGFYNGANFDRYYQPTVTSYDYNCPVSECGDLTPKYYAIHDRMEKLLNKKLPLTVANTKKMAYGRVILSQKAGLFDNLSVLSKPVRATCPMSFEELGADFGFVLYDTFFEGPFEKLPFEIDGLNDRAEIFIDDRLVGVKENTGKRDDEIYFGLDFNEKKNVKILVENMGRVNYGGHIFDHKGITKGVRIANRYHFGWTMYPISCEDISALSYREAEYDSLPGFYKGYIDIEEKNDTFVRLTGFTKGNVWINGFNIGRFFNTAGPQKTLYVPAPLLKTGTNEIVVLELEKCINGEISFEEREELG